MDLLLLTAVDPFSYQIIPDLGLMYLAGAVRKAGYEVDIKDCRKEGWDLEELARRLRQSPARVVGLKFYSNEALRAARMVEVIRREVPQATIIAGGPHPSMDPAGVLAAMPEVDYVFVGEAELALPRFLEWRLQGGRDDPPPEILGIAYRRPGCVEVRDLVLSDDLDGLGLPAWDLMRPDRYPDEAAGIFVKAFPAAPVMLSRGCPYDCQYCGCRYISGRQVRYRSPADILAEIDFLEREYKVRTFTFVDDNFTVNRERALELFEALASRNPPVAFTFPNGVRVDSLDERLLRTMERAGCYSLALGIESGSDETLRRMKKNLTTAQVRDAVALIRRTTKIKITGFFILGYPGEGLAEVKRTIDFACSLPIHHAHFCVFIPLPGTPVIKDLMASGWSWGDDMDLENMTIDRSAFELPGLPSAQVLRLHQYAYPRFYAHPARMLNLLGQIKTPQHLAVIVRRLWKLFRK